MGSRSKNAAREGLLNELKVELSRREVPNLKIGSALERRDRHQPLDARRNADRHDLGQIENEAQRSPIPHRTQKRTTSPYRRRERPSIPCRCTESRPCSTLPLPTALEREDTAGPTQLVDGKKSSFVGLSSPSFMV